MIRKSLIVDSLPQTSQFNREWILTLLEAATRESYILIFYGGERADWIMLQWQLYKISPKVATQIFDTTLQVKLTRSRLMHWKNTLVEFLPFCTSESPLKTWLL